MKRLKMGFSVRQMAKKIGKQPAAVSRIEKAQITVLEETMRLIAEAYEEPFDEIMLMLARVPSDVIEILQKRPEILKWIRNQGEK